MLAYESWGDFVASLVEAEKEVKTNPKPTLSSIISAEVAPSVTSMFKRLEEIAKAINVIEMVTPINAASEKRKWLEAASCGLMTCPQYSYSSVLVAAIANFESEISDMRSAYRDCEAIIKQGVHMPSIIMASVLQTRITEMIAATQIAVGILNRDGTSATGCVEELYGRPSEAVVKAAKDYARDLAKGDGLVYGTSDFQKSEIEQLQNMTFDAEGIKRVFQWAAERCGFADDRPIEVSKSATSIDVRDKSSRGAIVMIPEARKVSGIKLISLTAHEILCHWRDSANMPSPFLTKSWKSADEIPYEGHAMLAERSVNMMFYGHTPAMLRPWYIIAMDLAKAGCNFGHVAKEIYPMIKAAEGEEDALETTYMTCLRVFRGALDTSNNWQHSYAFTKDRAYFEGAILVDELQKAGLGNLTELGILGTTDLLYLNRWCRLDTENLKYSYSNGLLVELAERMLKGEFDPKD